MNAIRIDANPQSKTTTTKKGCEVGKEVLTSEHEILDAEKIQKRAMQERINRMKAEKRHAAPIYEVW